MSLHQENHNADGHAPAMTVSGAIENLTYIKRGTDPSAAIATLIANREAATEPALAVPVSTLPMSRTRKKRPRTANISIGCTQSRWMFSRYSRSREPTRC